MKDQQTQEQYFIAIAQFTFIEVILHFIVKFYPTPVL